MSLLPMNSLLHWLQVQYGNDIYDNKQQKIEKKFKHYN